MTKYNNQIARLLKVHDHFYILISENEMQNFTNDITIFVRIIVLTPITVKVRLCCWTQMQTHTQEASN